MKAKVCPKCGKHNSVDAWNCVDCGETLSLNTIAEVDTISSDSNKGKTPDAELFERGKNHFENREYGTAEKDFKEAIRLNSNNANYYAWLARTTNAMDGDKVKILDWVNKALEIDSRCVMALFARAIFYRKQKEYEKALKDCNLAIQLEPNNGICYLARSNIYRDLKDFENSVADKMHGFTLSPEKIQKHYSTDAKWQQKHSDWYETIFQHHKQMALPQLASEETFVEYYPAWFSWDMGESIYTGRDYEGRNVSTI